MYDISIQAGWWTSSNCSETLWAKRPRYAQAGRLDPRWLMNTLLNHPNTSFPATKQADFPFFRKFRSKGHTDFPQEQQGRSSIFQPKIHLQPPNWHTWPKHPMIPLGCSLFQPLRPSQLQSAQQGRGHGRAVALASAHGAAVAQGIGPRAELLQAVENHQGPGSANPGWINHV